MHGKGVYTWKDGRKYEGEYQNDKVRPNLLIIRNMGMAPTTGLTAGITKANGIKASKFFYKYFLDNMEMVNSLLRRG